MSPFKIPAQGEDTDTDSKYIGAGTHEVTVDEVDGGGVSAKGHPQLTVTFRNHHGQTIRDWLYPTRAMWRVQLLWEAAGVPWPADGGEIDENDLLDKRLLIVVEPDTYNGVTRDKVKDYQALVGSDLGYTPVSTPASGGDDNDPIPF